MGVDLVPCIQTLAHMAQFLQWQEAAHLKDLPDVLLIDEPETIGRAVPVLMKHFVPIRARIDRLHLCAFWPTREILRVELTGNK